MGDIEAVSVGANKLGSASGDEILRQHVTTLGPELGSVFHELRGDLLLLNEKWRAYLDLFGSSPRRVDLLDRAAPRFFALLRPTLFDDMALHLVRLTAPARSEVHSLPTVRRLPDLIHDETLRPSVKEDVAAAIARTAFAREWLDWRGESLAHRVLPSTVSGDRMKISSHHDEVREALGAIARPLNRVHQHFFRSELSFDAPGASGDTMDLLHVLNIGVNARRSAGDSETDVSPTI